MECHAQSAPNTIGMLSKMFCIFLSKSGDSSWNVWWVIAWTSKSWHTHTHTDTGDDNTRRPKGPRVKKVWRTLQRQRPVCDETQSWCVMPPTRCIYQVSSLYLKICRKKLRKLSGGGELCWDIPFQVFVATKGPNIAQPWWKAVQFKTLAM